MDINSFVKYINADGFDEVVATEGDPIKAGSTYYCVFKDGKPLINVSKNSLKNRDIYRIIKEINDKPLKSRYITK